MIVCPSPFPYTCGQLFDAELLQDVFAEFPMPNAPGWRAYKNSREGKLEGPEAMWGPATHRYFGALDQLTEEIGDWFEIPDMHLETIGGGYHLIPPGGHLDIHVDFNRSPDSNLYRRLNCLTYLNHDWQDDGGWLELWGEDGPQVRIPPSFGTTVIFATSDVSWHGHPTPAKRWRASIAGYFFSPEEPPGWAAEHSTVWRT